MVLLLYHVDTGQSTPRGGVSFVKGMTQAELAEKINVTQSMLCQIERGTKAPSWPLGTEIAVELNCALNALSRFITVYGNNWMNHLIFASATKIALENLFKCTFKHTKQGGSCRPENPMFCSLRFSVKRDAHGCLCILGTSQEGVAPNMGGFGVCLSYSSVSF